MYYILFQLFSCFPYSLGWICASVSDDVQSIYLSRILVGISNAVISTTVYTVEVADKERR